jgi:hypothetical protein
MGQLLHEAAAWWWFTSLEDARVKIRESLKLEILKVWTIGANISKNPLT